MTGVLGRRMTAEMRFCGAPSGPDASGAVTVGLGEEVDAMVLGHVEAWEAGKGESVVVSVPLLLLLSLPFSAFFDGYMVFPSSTTVRSLRWNKWKHLIFLPSST